MRNLLVLAAVLLSFSGVVMADTWTFTYSSSTFQASGTLQAAAFGGLTIATSGTGTLAYGGNTGTLTLIGNPCYDPAATFLGAGSFGCSGAPVFTVHGYPNSGGGDMIVDNVLIPGTPGTDVFGLAFIVTGDITGGFNPWNNQAAFFGNGGTITDNGGVLSSQVPEPSAILLFGTLLCAAASRVASARRKRS